MPHALLVFGLSKARFYQKFSRENPAIYFDISSKENFLLVHGK
jgi:hypothetical protein